MQYRRSELTDFSAVATKDGTIYHQRGGYMLDGEGELLMPANRSYRLRKTRGSSGNNPDLATRDDYTNHDRIINDDVDEKISLRPDERTVHIFGKALLFLKYNNENVQQQFSPLPSINNVISEDAKVLTDTLSGLETEFGAKVAFGVYGSHQVGLNRQDSDLDTIAWTPRDIRKEVLRYINQTLRSVGYISVNDTSMIDKYAKRYAARMGLTAAAGNYLARQRMRWLSPDGTSTSLQCLNADYDHSRAEATVNEGLNKISLVQDITYRNAEIIGESEPYNFPRLWRVAVDNNVRDVISFDWAHQGMAAEAEDKDYVLKGRRVVNDVGHEAIILANQSDYLLPNALVDA